MLFVQLIPNTMETHAITFTNIVVKCPDYINYFIQARTQTLKWVGSFFEKVDLLSNFCRALALSS